MLTRTTTFGLAIVLASVSGSLAAPRTHASTATTAYNPAYTGTETGQRSFSESEPTVWGWRHTPPQEPAHRQ